MEVRPQAPLPLLERILQRELNNPWIRRRRRNQPKRRPSLHIVHRVPEVRRVGKVEELRAELQRTPVAYGKRPLQREIDGPLLRSAGNTHATVAETCPVTKQPSSPTEIASDDLRIAPSCLAKSSEPMT